MKISYMPFMVKAASMALREHPILNASIDTEAEMLTYRDGLENGSLVA